MDAYSALSGYVGTFVMGGGIGFAMGFAIKKLIRWIIIGLGLVLALLAFLQYKGWINVNWVTVQRDLSGGAQWGAQNLMHTVNSTAQQVAKSGLNGMDIGYPILGIVGFMPGFLLGLKMG